MTDPYTDYATLSGDWEGWGPETGDDVPFGSLRERPPFPRADRALAREPAKALADETAPEGR